MEKILQDLTITKTPIRKAMLKLITQPGDIIIRVTYGTIETDSCLYFCCTPNDLFRKCYFCATHYGDNYHNQTINSKEIKFYICKNCIHKKACQTCLRESSLCQQIKSCKITTWLCLRQYKFPKDIIKFITKKVK